MPITDQRPRMHSTCLVLVSGPWLAYSAKKQQQHMRRFVSLSPCWGQIMNLFILFFYFINHAAKQLSCVLQHAQKSAKKKLPPSRGSQAYINLLQTEREMTRKDL